MKIKIELYDLSNREYLKTYEIEYKYPEELEELLFIGSEGIDIPEGYYLSYITYEPSIKVFKYYLYESGVVPQ